MWKNVALAFATGSVFLFCPPKITSADWFCFDVLVNPSCAVGEGFMRLSCYENDDEDGGQD